MGVLCAFAALVYVGLLWNVILTVGIGYVFEGRLLGLVGYAHGIGTDIGYKAGSALAVYFDAFVELLGDQHGELGSKAQLARGFLLHAAGGKGRGGMTALFGGLYVAYGKLISAAGDYIICGFLVVNVQLFAVHSVKFGFKRLAVALYLELGGDIPVFLRNEVVYFLFPVANDAYSHRLHAACGKASAHLCPEYRTYLVAHQPVKHPSRLLSVHKVHIYGSWFLD